MSGENRNSDLDERAAVPDYENGGSTYSTTLDLASKDRTLTTTAYPPVALLVLRSLTVPVRSPLGEGGTSGGREGGP